MEQILPLKQAYEDIDQLLSICTSIKNEMIETIDSCLAQQQQERSIIEIYMEVAHSHMMSVLSRFWEKISVKLSDFETLSLIDWCHIYLEELSQYGIHDIYLQNGFNNLCNAYSRKIHSRINSTVINIIKDEVVFKNSVVQRGDGILSTNAPNDMVQILTDNF